MINEIKLLLGAASDNYSDELIQLLCTQTLAEIETYTAREFDLSTNIEIKSIVERLVIIKLNRMATEGLESQSFSGASESYLDGYPADILAVLNRKRRAKLI